MKDLLILLWGCFMIVCLKLINRWMRLRIFFLEWRTKRLRRRNVILQARYEQLQAERAKYP